MNTARSRGLSRGTTRVEVESPVKRLSKNGLGRTSKLNLAKPFTSRSNRPKPFDLEADFNYDSSDDEDTPKNLKDEPEVASKSAARGRALYQKLCNKYGRIAIKNVLKQIGRNAISLAGYNLSHRELRAFFVAIVEAYVHNDDVLEEGENRDLQSLQLGGNSLGVREVNYITDFAQAYSPLVHVLLDNCRLCSRGLENLSIFLRTNKTLKKLDLSGNQFTDNHGQHIADIIDSSEYITELIVSRNELRESGIIIGEALAGNISLKHLDLSWNHIRGNGAIGICKGLAKNKALETINLAWNGFGYEGSAAMSFALKENTSLQSLDISNNRIYPQAVFELLKGLEKNKSLTTLKLGGNPITANMTSILLTKIQQWKESNLQELDLAGVVVDKDFNDILKQIQESRIFMVRYDMALPLNKGVVSTVDPKNIFNIDPVRILYFMKEHLRTIDLFLKVDKDNNQLLSKDEMKYAFEGAVFTVDPKNAFNIDPVRILYFMKEHLRTIDLFLKVDKDNNQLLSKDEMKYAFEMEGFSISDSALSSVMSYLDTNKDGEVDLLEFINGERRFKRQLIKEHEDEKLAEIEQNQKFSQSFADPTEKTSPRKFPSLNKPKMA